MRIVLVVTLVLASAACSSTAGGGDPTASRTPAVQVAAGLTIGAVVDGLVGPTQMIIGPDDRLWVAQLNGGENERAGQVVAVDLTMAEREVLVDGLDKPTGIAWVDDALWIATPDALLRAPRDALGNPQPVVDDLPNNGRSQGTLTPTPDGTLLYETSGRERQGGGFVEGSGTLWELDPAAPDDRQAVATGFKNAYAHAFAPDGTLWTTEVAKPIGGVAWPDELNRVAWPGDRTSSRPGAAYGWPACSGDRRPVEEYGGDRAGCQETVRPVVEFDAGATPTSIVASPFAADEFIVALWNAGRVVSVTTDGEREPQPFVRGLPRPQHLLVDGDSLLVSDHQQGVVYRIAGTG